MEKKDINQSKEDTKKGCGCLIVILIAIVAVGFGIHKYNVNKQHKATIAKQEQIAEQKKEVQEKKEEEAKKPPVVNFSGNIDPTSANVGSKVVIKVNIENTSSTKTIKGVHLYFGDKKFIKEGLNVVNVMNGGKEFGNTFIWNINIVPKESCSFNIICEAVKVGTYNTDILLKDVDGYDLINKDGNSQLNGQIIITP